MEDTQRLLRGYYLGLPGTGILGLTPAGKVEE